MKTTLFTSAAAAALTLTFASGTIANHCSWKPVEGPFLRKWRVVASGVDDIPGKCGGFWDNMNNRNFNGACGALSETSCGKDGNGDMAINFFSMSTCNGGHVESAWWEATRNQFGGITCNKEEPFKRV
ncbi:hypothetical protein SNK03_004407 [Fusarium graminearum]|uniref:Uncharacterized protein n=1 Tax=Gibberella zeae TaxID=5518 RepID=A0A2H3FM94_GIBZA|nr:hypothetical protein FG05_08180 [Fusarium graminearum]KAI6753577.1 hypothetical protein HG531_005746 [Fusarium graminearum]PCD20875.1 hypothetical protein FGRA07_05027 [Fusarium graminearum]CAF3490016.1 unnamed protein product [Fusarium graminearum]CAF3556928.1 unnamed protein product [Fusarium graminearum]